MFLVQFQESLKREFYSKIRKEMQEYLMDLISGG